MLYDKLTIPKVMVLISLSLGPCCTEKGGQGDVDKRGVR